MLNKISKPHIVDFLRMSDHKRWLQPRIRYASVRSKPELIQDLQGHFQVRRRGDLLQFQPLRAQNLPDISYCLKTRKYLLDGLQVDIPRMSRKKPVFSISYEKVTLFGPPPPRSALPAKPLGSVSSLKSLERDIGVLRVV